MRSGIEPFLPAPTTERPRGRSAAFARMSPETPSDNRSASNKPSAFTLPPEQAHAHLPAPRRDAAPQVSGRGMAGQRPDKISDEGSPTKSGPSKAEPAEQPDPGPGPDVSNSRAAALQEPRSDPPEGAYVQACELEEPEKRDLEDEPTEEAGAGDASAAVTVMPDAPPSGPSPAGEPAVAVIPTAGADAALAPAPIAGPSVTTGQATAPGENAAPTIGKVEGASPAGASPASPPATRPQLAKENNSATPPAVGEKPAASAQEPAVEMAPEKAGSEISLAKAPADLMGVAGDLASTKPLGQSAIAGESAVNPTPNEAAVDPKSLKEEQTLPIAATTEPTEPARREDAKVHLASDPALRTQAEPAVNSPVSVTAPEIPPALPHPGLVGAIASPPAHLSAVPTGAHPPLAVVHQVPLGAVPIEIGMRSLNGANRFEIRLDPEELGRIDVRLDIDRDGGVKARLVVDRVETLALLQRDARTLERAFEQAGLKPSDGGVDLSLRDQPGHHSHQGRGDDRPTRDEPRPAQLGPTGAIEPPSPPRRLTWSGSTGIDVKV